MKTKPLRIHVTPLQFSINPDNIAEGFTQSEMQMLDDCPEKWYLTYNMMLKKRGAFSWALQYGTWIHSALEEWYTSGCRSYTWEPEIPMHVKKFLSAPMLALEEYWREIGRVQMQVYVSHYKKDRKVLQLLQKLGAEQIVDLSFEGIRLKGLIDLPIKHLLRNANFIMDHKTCSRLDKQTTMGWNFRFQFIFYNWLAWKAWPEYKFKGTIINAIKKPALQFNPQKESVHEHTQRVQESMMEKPDEYFYREPLLLTKGNLQEFEDTILKPKLHRIKLFRDPKISDEIKFAILRNKNTSHCVAYGQACPFLPACQHGLETEAFQYHVRETKHEELNNE